MSRSVCTPPRTIAWSSTSSTRTTSGGRSAVIGTPPAGNRPGAAGQRQGHLHRPAAARAGTGDQPAAPALGALAHGDQPEALPTGARLRRLPGGAVVADLDPQPVPAG